MLKPLADRIIAKPAETAQKTKGGIFLPDVARERPREAEVIAVGPGRLSDAGARTPLEIRVGDNVIYSRYGGTELRIGQHEYMILREDDILAVTE